MRLARGDALRGGGKLYSLLTGISSRGFCHLIHNPAELIQAGRRNNHIIAAAIHIFSDAQEPASGIFLKGENKCLPLNLDLFRLQRILVHRRLGRAGTVRAMYP